MACQISHQLLFCSSVVFFFTSPRVRGALLAKNTPLGDHPRLQNRPYGAPRLNFFEFLVHRQGVQKWWFFGIAAKRQKSDDKSNLGRPCRHCGPQNMTFEVPFGIVFSLFFRWPKIKKSVCFLILFNGFGPSKTIYFPIVFSLNFHVFSKPFLGTVFRGSQRRTFLKSWVWVPFPIFMIFKKASFGRPFCPSRRQKPSTSKYGERPCRDPAFHETTVILVPLGPSVFKNIIFSMMIGYFSVFSAFRCAMFYMSFLSHLLKKPQ